jgi:NAD(P)-dependent dehydrogenase (short-subunit alcohol dehydrogenase family)
MDKSIVLITGSTDGIGKQTALELAALGHKIILHGRDKIKCIKNVNQIESETGNTEVEYVTGDFSSIYDVKKMASELLTKYDRLDIVINNAGVYMNEKVITVDGFETTFAVNHLAPFLLTNMLLPLIRNSGSARIINVSSVAHTRAQLDWSNLNGEKKFDGYSAYALSKLANVLFTYKLAEILKNEVITVNALHPGVITTKLLLTGFNIKGASLREGAATSVYLASSPEVTNVSGKYFTKCIETQSSSESYDLNLQTVLWKKSEEFVNL